jgi:hypothetical protein
MGPWKAAKTPPGWASARGFGKISGSLGEAIVSIREITACLVLGISGATPAVAQQSPVLKPEIGAERQAAQADLMRAEKLLSGGGARVPDSEACKLLDSYFMRIVKIAIAAGAKTRMAAWQDLTLEERNAVGEKVDANLHRDNRMRQHACTAAKQ